MAYSREFLTANQLPADLCNLATLFSGVMRYQTDWYPQVFADQNLMVHLLRVVHLWRSRSVPPGVSKELGERMLWVHDIDEVEDEIDITAPELEANPQLALEKKAKGELLAEKYLPGPDYLLYLRWNQAGRFWKGDHNDPADLTAIAAKLYDMVDSDIVFHERLAQYCEENGVSKLDPRINSSLTHTFRQFPKRITRLRLLPAETRSWFETTNLLPLIYIRQFWANVPDDNIPPSIQDYLFLMLKLP